MEMIALLQSIKHSYEELIDSDETHLSEDEYDSQIMHDKEGLSENFFRDLENNNNQ